MGHYCHPGISFHLSFWPARQLEHGNEVHRVLCHLRLKGMRWSQVGPWVCNGWNLLKDHGPAYSGIFCWCLYLVSGRDEFGVHFSRLYQGSVILPCCLPSIFTEAADPADAHPQLPSGWHLCSLYHSLCPDLLQLASLISPPLGFAQGWGHKFSTVTTRTAHCVGCTEPPLLE